MTNSFPTASELAERHKNDPILSKHSRNALIVVSNFDWRWDIGLIQRLYQPYFATTIFCGPFYPNVYYSYSKGFPDILNSFNYIHMNSEEMYHGYFGYECLTLAKELRLNNIDGYIHMADDTVFNLWQNIDFSKVFHLTGIAFLNDRLWWTRRYGLSKAHDIVDFIKNTTDPEILSTWKEFEDGLRLYKYINESQTAFDDMLLGKSRSLSDFYYIPSSKIEYYSKLMRIFYRHRLFLELAVNKFLRSVPHKTARELTKLYLWGNRGQWPSKYNSSMVAMHPIKLSMFQEPSKKRYIYCSKVIQTFHDILLAGSKNYTVKQNDEPDWMNG
ncbi:unnamed protein product [Caenorhabditis bovis]|uniref:Uncharacterized protein n=1 Tax=Caenorhabditis bovis TaxID=2654633 RepID=A0A8S1EDH9_9PELO|nr:unnamed protein product [Caenorhabditis bovis]